MTDRQDHTDAGSPQPASPPTVGLLLQQAIAHHQAGRLPEAERLYRAILQTQPNHPDANHNLGVLALQVKQAAAALPHFRTALEANPNHAQYRLGYIEALIQASQLDDARRMLHEGRLRGLRGEAVEALARRLVGHVQFVAPSNAASPSQQEINALVALFAEGRYGEVADLARALTVRSPQHGLAWKGLGAALSLLERNAEALEPMRKAAALMPQDAEAHSNLGNTLRELGRLDEAEVICRQAIQVKPDYTEAHSNLGNTLRELGRLDEAEASYRRALQVKPDYAEAHSNLGNTLRELGRLDEAEVICRQAIQVKPDFAEAHINLGNTLRELGRLDEAEASYRRALQVKPDYAEAHSNLGNTLRELGRLDEAEASYRRALQVKPDYAEAHSNLGNTLRELGRLDEAEASYRRALQVKPDYAEAHSNLGNTLRELGRLDEAEVICRQAIQVKPDFAEAHINLGNTLKELGQMDEAEASYRRALQVKPHLIDAHFNLAQTRKVSTNDGNLDALIAIEKAERNGTTPLSNKDLMQMNFALGKCYDDLGDHDKAFPHFMEGCRLKRATLDYDAKQTTQHFGAIMHNFDAAVIARLRGGGDPSSLPIFVLGMPRSGTTLTEHILASHPEIYGAGELLDLIRITQRNIEGITFPPNVSSLDQAQLTAWGAEYVAGLQRRAPDARRITDKMPANFLALGLIHLMLPNAKIVHVRRDPVDTCLSCFSKLFTYGQEFSYDLSELGRYYADYARLMEHWRKVLPDGTFLEVQYEDIVADQEAQARRLIEYCGLEWDDACLDFHKNKRAIHTASVTQVRQPIYKTSVQRWRSYEKFLGPLFEALGEFAPER
jgi:tetratricopeptide (TPR) repeat protein